MCPRHVSLLYFMVSVMVWSAVSSGDGCISKCPCTGINTRHPSTKLDHYYMCTSEHMLLFKCPPEQQFDITSQVCVASSPNGSSVACEEVPEPCRNRVIRSIEGSGNDEGSGYYFSEICDPSVDSNCQPLPSLFNP